MDIEYYYEIVFISGVSIKNSNTTSMQLHSSTVDSYGVTVVNNKTGTKELILSVLGKK